MNSRFWGALLLATSVVAGSIATSALAASLGRDALRSVVNACVVAKSTLGVSFPCTDVRLSTPGKDGYALIRSPGFDSEFLVTTVDPVDGIESPALRADSATDLWNAAWSARSNVAAALKKPLQRTDVGLAVNAEGNRTQDHFHIHVDCVLSSVASRLAATPGLGQQWRKLPSQLRGDSYWVRTLEGTDLQGVNVAQLLETSPPAESSPFTRAAVAVLGAKLHDGSDGFYVLANWTDTSAERLLDHNCKGR